MLRHLWHRELSSYPRSLQRYTNLAIVVLATVVLYYELYITGAVAPQILADYDMTFPYFVGILVVGNGIGAMTSLLAGLADRWGRANLVTVGLLLTGLLTAFAVPATHSKLAFGVVYALIGFVEGIILVATPALVRDFSPQLGRASAMGFWTLGPVVGSLVVAEVTSRTLTGDDWRHQFVISGVVGLVVWLLALVLLRELSPGLRDQVMVSLADRELVESRAGTVEATVDRSWRAVLQPRVVGSALAIAVYLLLYYTAVAFFVIYLGGVQGRATADANSLLKWYWWANAIALVVVGVASDRLAVRKPFMVAGGVGTAVVTLVLIGQTTTTPASDGTLHVLLALFGVLGGLAFAPWMAAFTEDVERRNPAASAAGLAVWGWVLRAVVAVSFLLLPQLISSATPLAQYGPRAQAFQAGHPQLVAAVRANQALVTTLGSYPSPGDVPAELQAEAVTRLGIVNALSLSDPTVQTELRFLQAHGAAVLKAQHDAPGEWRRWFWICFGGQVLFVPLVLLMGGSWSPRRARAEVAAHETAVRQELAGR